jgi:carboxyl-terminal processing protease
MSWRGVTRWVGFSAAAAAALGTAFTLGVVAGAGSAPPPPPQSPPGLLDDAASQIAGNSLKPVDRGALDAAAMRAMLGAAGDRWGHWGGEPTPVVPRAVTMRMLHPHVGLIAVPAFTQGTGRQVRAAVAALHQRHATGIVLDLRGNSGGLLSESVETASAFLRGGRVVTYTRRDERPQRLDAVGSGDITTDLVVLVDGGTASGAEVVAGALQDRGRAVIVGSRTFGKGSVQEPHRLSDGSSLALTVARYTLPSGRSVDGVGIEPDIDVVSPRAMIGRALEVLIGLRADTNGGSG